MKVRLLARHEAPLFVDCRNGICPEETLEIPPIREAVLGELMGMSVFSQYGTWQMFLAEGPAGPLGRVAALVNPRLLDPEGQPYGQVGYFECVQDAVVSRSLLEAAVDWLTTQGVRRVLGPMNGGAHRMHRFLVEGFDTEPFLFEPRNPAYYPRLFQDFGFRECHSWSTFELQRSELEPLRRLLGKRVTRHGSGERIDLLEPSDAQGTLARIHPLLDGVWKGHVGYASIGQEELAEVFGGVLSLMTSRHIGVLVDGSGQDTGCSFMYPDYANDVRNLRGSARGWGEWLGRGSQPSGLVMHTLALLEEARGSAGSAMLLQRGLEHFFEDGYERLIVALVVEDWPLFRRFKAPSRRYALYEGQAGNFETG